MNNSKTLWRNFLRGQTQQSMITSIRRQSPQYDQYLSRHRYPSYPKIVLYSNHQSHNKLLENILPFFNTINPSVSGSDYQMAEQIAKAALNSNPKGSYNGVFIYGFPYNTAQALYLDQFLGGVNMAIYMNSGSQYKSSISNMLNYYNQRGALYEINDCQNSSLQNIESIRRAITENIKLE